MDKLNFAILGAGRIARKMARTIAQMPEVNLYAVAARDEVRAGEFAHEFGFEKAYGSYEEMVRDDKVQLVYIATPHSHHHAHASLCLNNGKAVLCEKAFTANAKQAKEIIGLAHKNKLLLVEAMWSRFMPLAATIKELVEGGSIGKPALLMAGFGHNSAHKLRMASPELAGGALLDLGVYPITFASIAFGSNVQSVHSAAQLTPEGVDAQNVITLLYDNGRMANLSCTMRAKMLPVGKIFGDEAHIEVGGMNNYEFVRVLSPDGEQKAFYPRPPQITGFEYQVLACIKALREGQIECSEMPHAETLRIMEMMDGLRAEWGVKYPFE